LEVWTGDRIGKKADIWALGCSIVEMICAYEKFKDPYDLKGAYDPEFKQPGHTWADVEDAVEQGRPDKFSWRKHTTRQGYLTKAFLNGKDQEMAKRNLMEGKHTYSEKNPWNLMGMVGIESFPILEQMEQIDSKTFGQAKEYRDEATGEVKKIETPYSLEAQSQLLIKDKDNATWGLRGHSWILALQMGNHPPFPKSDEIGSQLYNFLMSCFRKYPQDRPDCAELLQDPYITGETQIVTAHRVTSGGGGVNELVRRKSSGLRQRTREDYKHAGFHWDAANGAMVNRNVLSSSIARLQNEKMIPARSPFLLYSIDVITRNYLDIQESMPERDALTVSLLYRVALHRGEEIVKHISQLRDVNSNRIMAIYPVVRSSKGVDAVNKAWDTGHQRIGSQKVVVDSARHCGNEDIRARISNEDTFRIYNEFDLDRITNAFLCRDEDETVVEKLLAKRVNTDINILLASDVLSSESCAPINPRLSLSPVSSSNLATLLEKLEEIATGKEDIHFKIKGLHGFACEATAELETDVDAVTEGLAEEIGQLVKARKSGNKLVRELVETGGLELHLEGCMGSLRRSRGQSCKEKKDPFLNRFVGWMEKRGLVGLDGINALKVDLSNDLLSQAICLVDHVVGGKEEVVVEEGPADPSAKAMPVLGAASLAELHRQPGRHMESVPILSWSRDMRSSEEMCCDLPHGIPESRDHMAFQYNMQTPPGGVGYPLFHEEQYRAGARYIPGQASPTPEEYLPEFLVKDSGTNFERIRSHLKIKEQLEEANTRAKSAEEMLAQSIENARRSMRGGSGLGLHRAHSSPTVSRTATSTGAGEPNESLRTSASEGNEPSSGGTLVFRRAETDPALRPAGKGREEEEGPIGPGSGSGSGWPSANERAAAEGEGEGRHARVPTKAGGSDEANCACRIH
jgi:serine/threonine protein kinase